jgi:Protein of unknown function (DUF559)
MIELGLNPRQIQRLVDNGEFVRAAHGVVRVGLAPKTWMQQVWIGALSAGSQSVISHRSAAALLGLEGFDRTGVVEIIVPRRLRYIDAGVLVHSSIRLDRLDIVRPDGLALTSATRTIIDLAASGLSADVLGNAIDSAVRLRLASPDYIQRRLTALGRQRTKGSAILDELMLDAGGHSYLERRFLKLIRSAGIERPECQVVHRREGRTVARVDFEWRPARLVVEVNGRRGHSSAADRAKDARRRNGLQADGLTVMEFTTSQVIDDPGYVIGVVQAHLTSRSAFATVSAI